MKQACVLLLWPPVPVKHACYCNGQARDLVREIRDEMVWLFPQSVDSDNC